MTIAIAAVGSGPGGPQVPGARRTNRVKVTFDASYPAGGYVLTAANFGLTALDDVTCELAQDGTLAGVFVQSTSKLMLFSAIGTENGTADIHTKSMVVSASGV